ncbi:MAG: hypothetical protein B6245_00385 [Desulfobacteraceae bacterium 4572_88]|nr:MAG: hypothetical protein B6245_00385 [Desulfobacteraceae bacterium 4572_88]
MAERKAFITSDNTVTFTCPICRKSETENVSKYKDIDEAAKIKFECTCGHTYNILLERRKFYRKETQLPGIYIFDQEDAKPLTIKDMSLMGLKFEAKDGKFKPGERLFVKFSLDDEQNTRIRKEVIVKKIAGQFVGVEFCTVEPENPGDKAIRKYIIP